MRTELAKSALKQMNQYKSECTPKQWGVISDGIKEFDNLLQGSGFYAIQAKTKLKRMLSFSCQDFKAFQFLNPN